MTVGDGNLQWKTRVLVRIAAGRPFVWVDDGIGDQDRRFVATEHDGAALLHQVESAVGVAVADLDVIAAWVREVGGVSWFPRGLPFGS